MNYKFFVEEELDEVGGATYTAFNVDDIDDDGFLHDAAPQGIGKTEYDALIDLIERMRIDDSPPNNSLVRNA